MPEDSRPIRTVYLAGELFSAKHLAGNALLAERITEASEQFLTSARFRCVLPQDLPQKGATPHMIRDQDLRALLACDAAVFHYDGLELDSGTVVEYLFAKFADIPSVLVRTDFRHSGDQPDGPPWNLMNSFYPRTEAVWINSMDIYHDHLRENPSSTAAAGELVKYVASHICAALNRVLAIPPVLPSHLAPAVYKWLALMPGFEHQPAVIEEAARLYTQKVAKGLL